jgi:hypothetical protein
MALMSLGLIRRTLGIEVEYLVHRDRPPREMAAAAIDPDHRLAPNISPGANLRHGLPAHRDFLFELCRGETIPVKPFL